MTFKCHASDFLLKRKARRRSVLPMGCLRQGLWRGTKNPQFKIGTLEGADLGAAIVEGGWGVGLGVGSEAVERGRGEGRKVGADGVGKGL